MAKRVGPPHELRAPHEVPKQPMAEKHEPAPLTRSVSAPRREEATGVAQRQADVHQRLAATAAPRVAEPEVPLPGKHAPEPTAVAPKTADQIRNEHRQQLDQLIKATQAVSHDPPFGPTHMEAAVPKSAELGWGGALLKWVGDAAGAVREHGPVGALVGEAPKDAKKREALQQAQQRESLREDLVRLNASAMRLREEPLTFPPEDFSRSLDLARAEFVKVRGKRAHIESDIRDLPRQEILGVKGRRIRIARYIEELAAARNRLVREITAIDNEKKAFLLKRIDDEMQRATKEMEALNRYIKYFESTFMPPEKVAAPAHVSAVVAAATPPAKKAEPMLRPWVIGVRDQIAKETDIGKRATSAATILLEQVQRRSMIRGQEAALVADVLTAVEHASPVDTSDAARDKIRGTDPLEQVANSTNQIAQAAAKRVLKESAAIREGLVQAEQEFERQTTRLKAIEVQQEVVKKRIKELSAALKNEAVLKAVEQRQHDVNALSQFYRNGNIGEKLRSALQEIQRKEAELQQLSRERQRLALVTNRNGEEEARFKELGNQELLIAKSLDEYRKYRQALLQSGPFPMRDMDVSNALRKTVDLAETAQKSLQEQPGQLFHQAAMDPGAFAKDLQGRLAYQVGRTPESEQLIKELGTRERGLREYFAKLGAVKAQLGAELKEKQDKVAAAGGVASKELAADIAKLTAFVASVDREMEARQSEADLIASVVQRHSDVGTALDSAQVVNAAGEKVAAEAAREELGMLIAVSGHLSAQQANAVAQRESSERAANFARYQSLGKGVSVLNNETRQLVQRQRTINREMQARFLFEMRNEAAATEKKGREAEAILRKRVEDRQADFSAVAKKCRAELVDAAVKAAESRRKDLDRRLVDIAKREAAAQVSAAALGAGEKEKAAVRDIQKEREDLQRDIRQNAVLEVSVRLKPVEAEIQKLRTQIAGGGLDEKQLQVLQTQLDRREIERQTAISLMTELGSSTADAVQKQSGSWVPTFAATEAQRPFQKELDAIAKERKEATAASIAESQKMADENNALIKKLSKDIEAIGESTDPKQQALKRKHEAARQRLRAVTQNLEIAIGWAREGREVEGIEWLPEEAAFRQKTATAERNKLESEIKELNRLRQAGYEKRVALLQQQKDAVQAELDKLEKARSAPLGLTRSELAMEDPANRKKRLANLAVELGTCLAQQSDNDAAFHYMIKILQRFDGHTREAWRDAGRGDNPYPNSWASIFSQQVGNFASALQGENYQRSTSQYVMERHLARHGLEPGILGFVEAYKRLAATMTGRGLALPERSRRDFNGFVEGLRGSFSAIMDHPEEAQMLAADLGHAYAILQNGALYLTDAVPKMLQGALARRTAQDIAKDILEGRRRHIAGGETPEPTISVEMLALLHLGSLMPYVAGAYRGATGQDVVGRLLGYFAPEGVLRNMVGAIGGTVQTHAEVAGANLMSRDTEVLVNSMVRAYSVGIANGEGPIAGIKAGAKYALARQALQDAGTHLHDVYRGTGIKRIFQELASWWKAVSFREAISRVLTTLAPVGAAIGAIFVVGLSLTGIGAVVIAAIAAAYAIHKYWGYISRRTRERADRIFEKVRMQEALDALPGRLHDTAGTNAGILSDNIAYFMERHADEIAAGAGISAGSLEKQLRAGLKIKIKEKVELLKARMNDTSEEGKQLRNQLETHRDPEDRLRILQSELMRLLEGDLREHLRAVADAAVKAGSGRDQTGRLGPREGLEDEVGQVERQMFALDDSSVNYGDRPEAGARFRRWRERQKSEGQLSGLPRDETPAPPPSPAATD